MEMLLRLWGGPRLAINQLNPDVLELEGVGLGVGEAVFPAAERPIIAQLESCQYDREGPNFT
jgi:hypothetical protein